VYVPFGRCCPVLIDCIDGSSVGKGAGPIYTVDMDHVRTLSSKRETVSMNTAFIKKVSCLYRLMDTVSTYELVLGARQITETILTLSTEFQRRKARKNVMCEDLRFCGVRS